MKAIKEFANAKINLFLDVSGIREDSFHEVRTVMHSVSLADEITVLYSPAKKTEIKMHLFGDTRFPSDERNLAYRAAALFLDAAGLSANIEIHLRKNIPIAAGLAGGSSDAAATLRAMNKLFGRIFSNSALLRLASELGSDVPYCLFGKTALCEGRGERITRLNKNPALNVLILNSGEYVKTPEAYSALDKIYSDFGGERGKRSFALLNSQIESINGGSFDEKTLYNIFEDAIFPVCPIAKSIKERLISMGASGALMSGSGSSVFGIFDNEEKMNSARDVFLKEGIRAFSTKSV